MKVMNEFLMPLGRVLSINLLIKRLVTYFYQIIEFFSLDHVSDEDLNVRILDEVAYPS